MPTATKKKSKPRAQRMKDAETGTEAPGFGPKQPVIPTLTAAIERYMEGRDERMDASKTETELKGAVLDLMHRHNLTTYTDHDAEVAVEIIAEKEKVKARRLKDEADDDSDGDEE